MKYRLLIADDEPFICNMLAKIIRCDKLGIEIAGIAYDGEQLLHLIEQEQPDIVVTDISMPKMDGLEVIRCAREAHYTCRFVIISGYHQYQYASNTLRYDVDDYLVKPVDEEELNGTLREIVQSLGREVGGAGNGKSYEAIRAGFVEGGFRQLEEQSVDLPILNETYHLQLQEGLFQFLLVKLEHESGDEGLHEDVSSVMNKLHNLVSKQFAEACHDIVYYESIEGVLALLNFREQERETIQSGFRDLLQSARSVANMFKGMGITICVGAEVREPAGLKYAMETVRDAEWARIFFGINRIICCEELPLARNEAYRVKLIELYDEFTEAFTSLNQTAYKGCVDSLFSCLPKALRSKETHDFCRKIFHAFFDINAERIRPYADVRQLEQRTDQALQLCADVPSYRSALKSLFIDLMEQILQFERERGIGVLAALDGFLAENYANMPSLDQMAGILRTAPEVLQEVLCHEAGEEYEPYLTRFRVDLAQKRIKDGERPGRALAKTLGFSDARAFAKEFKGIVGIRPEAYWKIFR